MKKLEWFADISPVWGFPRRHFKVKLPVDKDSLTETELIYIHNKTENENISCEPRY